jgi:Protein of unknown function, DUF488
MTTVRASRTRDDVDFPYTAGVARVAALGLFAIVYGPILSTRQPPRSVHVNEHPTPRVAHWPTGAIFTLGHSTLPIDRFIALLHSYGIKRLVDIRTIPRSRHNPQFNDSAMATALMAERIEYVPLQALGGLRNARKDSPNSGWRNRSFRGYADYMQTAAFQDGLELLLQLSSQMRAAIMCAEALPWRCHRSLVADALDVRGIPVIEILSENVYRTHKRTPFAHVEGTQITYPAAQATLL